LLVVGAAVVGRRILFRALFSVGYRLYVSPIGYRFAHLPLIMKKKKKPGHSIFGNQHVFEDHSLSVVPVSILDDNYCYLLIDKSTSFVVAIDPSDPFVVLDAVNSLKAQNSSIRLTHVLTTHRHFDHAGGNRILKEKIPQLEVIGGAGDDVLAATKHVVTGDRLLVGQLEVSVRQVPCHTKGHVLYLCGNLLFTGDTLFTGGCGKFFEGDAAQMFDNLIYQIGSLPSHTLIFPGHEYTVSNLEFAVFIDPDNVWCRNKLAWAQAQRSKGFGTIPSTLAEEKSYNPFLRVESETVRCRVFQLSPRKDRFPKSSIQQQPIHIAVLAELRRLKDDGIHIQTNPKK